MESKEKTSARSSFTLAPDCNVSGTYRYGILLLSPAAFIRRFGDGEFTNDPKLSRQWVFRKQRLIFTVYDWKATSRYDPILPTPDAFWSSESPMELHYGSRFPATSDDARDFAEWLVSMTSDHLTERAAD